MFNNTIFALDDELVILELFNDILTDRKAKQASFFNALETQKNDAPSYDLRTFATPKLYLEGLESWYAQGYRVPLSILDMRLPQMHGLEVAKKAREIDKEMVIIVVTAYSDHTVTELLGQLQSNVFYLRKPFGHDELLALVTTSMKNWNAKADIATLMQDIAIDVTEDGMWDWNPITNAVVYSPKWKQMLGYEEHEIANNLEEWSKRVHPEDMQEVMRTLQEHLEQKSPYYISEHRLLCKDGSYKWVLDRGKASFAQNGKPSRVVGFHTDITKRKALEEELFSKSANLSEELKEILSNQTKLKSSNKTLELQLKEEIEKRREKEELLLQHTRQAAMGEMISMIAHQWRQPLTTIGLSSDNMLFDIALDNLDAQSLEENLKTIKNQVMYLSRTIDDFRTFFMPNKEKEHICVHDCLENTLGLIGKNLEQSGIDVRLFLEDTTPLFLHKNELVQVFLNILQNAKDVLMQKKRTAPTITIKSFEDAQSVTVVIADNGGGIEKEHLYKIFEPYFTTKQNLNGTGLGLYMSKTIIEERCCGSIKAQNSSDGAEFIMIFKKVCE